MITREELTRIASKKGFRNIATIEKDYALTWALKAIYSNERLSKYLVFKGGTCLSKVYAETYRLSEDLDFSGYNEGKMSVGELEQELEAAFKKANEDGAPNLMVKKDETHSNSGYVSFMVRYVGPLGHPGTIKLEIKTDEYVKMASENLPLKEKAYPDISPFKIHCYHFFEMCTEKVRAIMQRGKSRDYYDVWQMLTNPLLNKNLPKMIFGMRRDLLEKCEQNKIAYEPEKIFNKDKLEQAKSHWKDTLGYLVKDLPDFDQVIKDMEEELFEEAELARFSEDFDTNHIRSIVRQEVSGVLVVRAIELVRQKLDSKKVSEVEIALGAVPKMNALLSPNHGWAIAMSQKWKPMLEALSDDKDTKIADAAKSYLNMLNSRRTT